MKHSAILIILILTIFSSCETNKGETKDKIQSHSNHLPKIILNLDQGNRLATLPLGCIQTPFPYKSGIVLASPEDIALPQEHHPAFYGCFDWHSAVHGHWSLIYLLKKFPNLESKTEIIKQLSENLTKENIIKEVEYFSMNDQSKSFERTYGWVWLLKLVEELHTWDSPLAKKWETNLQPLTDYIVDAYIEYLPKLVYPIRVGEHSNTAFGLSFASDYAQTVGDSKFATAIDRAARRFYLSDQGCPITWEPSGYDFLSPCLQELDIMRKVLSDAEFSTWSRAFLPQLFDGSLSLAPGKIIDRTDGKLVHLDGLNFSRAWCLYSLTECQSCLQIADQHLAYSLNKIKDGDYAGQHWLASFALYAFKSQSQD